MNQITNIICGIVAVLFIYACGVFLSNQTDIMFWPIYGKLIFLWWVIGIIIKLIEK